VSGGLHGAETGPSYGHFLKYTHHQLELILGNDERLDSEAGYEREFTKKEKKCFMDIPITTVMAQSSTGKRLLKI
jgi:hypothetical protein